MSKYSNIIVALDQMSLDEIDLFLKNKINDLEYVKIGLELFVKYGPDLIYKINSEYNKKIFLDLKLHDIPVTVQKAIESLKNLPIHFLTIHLSGGEEMIELALSESRKSLPQTKILGVSFLTSLNPNDLKQLFGIVDYELAFKRLLTLAKKTRIDGVVSSAHEIKWLKDIAPELLSVTPGIRFHDEITNSSTQDQKRVSTPQDAFLSGADYIVMGRSLTKAVNLSDRLTQLKKSV